MTVWQGLALWVSTFANVGLLGFQSRNVSAGRYLAAGCTSFFISAVSLIAVRGMVEFNPWLVLAITGTAGPAGIMSSIALSHRVHGR